MSEARTHRRTAPVAVAAALAAALALAACGQFRNPLASDAPPAEPVAAAIPNAQPDARGVITYANYQVAVARDGDSIATVAGRVGTTAARARRPQRPARGLHAPPGRGPAPARQRGAARDLGPPASTPARSPPSPSARRPPWPPAPAPQANPFQNGQTEPLIDPVRHRVEAGETAYSIARLYGVSVTALASWNGLGPDLAVRENQELLIPIVSDANRISTAASIDTQPGQGTPVAPPPSAAAPLPADITAAVEPESPNLGALRTPPGGRLSPPVVGGVTRPYDGKQRRRLRRRPPAPRSRPPPPARWRWSPRRSAASAPSCSSATGTT